MKVVVTQSRTSKSVKGRRLYGTSKCAGRSKTNIVNQHDDNIGCLCGCANLETGWRLDVSRVEFAVGWSFRFLNRQDRAIELILCQHEWDGTTQQHNRRADDLKN